MPKKVRLWICPCCRAAYSRKKNQDSMSLIRCSLCGCLYRKAIKYPVKNYYNYKCKHRKAKQKAAQFKDEYYLKPKNLGGQVLKFSPDTIKAFRSLYQSKRCDTFERRANIFLHLLYKDINNYPDNSFMKYIADDGSIKKRQGGHVLIPEFKIDSPWSGHSLMTHIYKRSDFINIFQFNLSYKGYQSYNKNDLYKDFFFLICDWFFSIYGMSHNKDYRLHWFKWFQKKFNIYGGVNL